jgi:RimJ/RimL family protein N-acetyltransferase
MSNLGIVLHGDDFMLRPWRIEDARWYVEARDEEVLKWTEEKRDLTVEQAEEGIRQANRNPDAICLAIVDNKNGELLGNIALAFKGSDRSSAEIMYWLAPQGRGRGIATNSVRLLCKWAFESLGLERVTLKTRPGNTASELVAERAGFQIQEGDNVGERPVDSLWFKQAGGKSPGRCSSDNNAGSELSAGS